MPLSRLTARLTKLFWLLPFITAPAYAEPMVWLAKDQQREFVFFGSIHAGNDSLYPLPKPFHDHWAKADALVVEANILKPSNTRLSPSQPTVLDQLDDSEKEKLAQVVKQTHLSNPTLLNSPPWLAAIQLQMAMAVQAGLSTEQGIDITLLQRAEEDKLPILELESVEQQIAMMEQLDDHGKDLLMSTVNEWEAMQSQLQCLLDAWTAGDHQQLLALFNDSQYSASTDEALIFERNRNWAKTLSSSPQYQQGRFIIVVGALHLFGEQGVPALLRQQGFDVSLLTEGKKSRCHY
ncbi:TraB/GumN family protein [Photobacterium sanctipauli]|uniref:TraB/GumN family protein n=1 Tax=Photobacterium sanctipauli TaxID=1342794 RepID=A0A2T3NGU1_9GAMM|nr:TraB/GumN family protein [Photobacterium sanctipauli]PSW13944.1 TraB/GumN family protein [Photobacterium sanctipauli]